MTPIINAGLGLGYESRGTREHVFNRSDIWQDYRVGYFTINPSFSFSGVNMGFVFGFPVGGGITNYGGASFDFDESEVGQYDELVYAGHVGGGFSQRTLKQVYELLEPLKRKTSPFTTTPRTNEKAHWVKPEIVVQVRYNEMTNEGKLRQPVFLGVRDDKDARSVRLEK